MLIIFLKIIVFILVFSLLVLIHEFGHFIMAKRAGIKVEEFGIGLPPRLWGKKKGETIYSVNAIPFGGFVRMLGEDSTDPKSLKNKRSFIAQPMRARVKVIVAGVVMNFFLAWILIVIGFTAGMEPLLGPSDVLPAIEKGQIVLEPGLKIEIVEEGSVAMQVGFKPDDVIYSFNDGELTDLLLTEMSTNPVGVYGVYREDEVMSFKVEQEQIEPLGEDGNLGITFYDAAQFPRVEIFDLENFTASYKAGLRPGDVILTVNDQQIFETEQYETLTRGVSTLEYEIYRDGQVSEFIVERDQARKVLISDVLPDMPAAAVGLQNRDIVYSINGNLITDSQGMIDFVQEHKDEKLAYVVERDGQKVFFEIKPDENGLIGVIVSELMSYGVDQGMSLYNNDLMSSVVKIKDEKYPLHVSLYKALGETYRMSKMTAAMFIQFVGGLIVGDGVPDSVAGPVGIAQITFDVMKDGFIPMLRLVAILSLSLAVINILPFPALDGGRLLFIVIEFIIGRKVNQKWEAMIHMLGYILVLLLILVVTYSDVMKLILS